MAADYTPSPSAIDEDLAHIQRVFSESQEIADEWNMPYLSQMLEKAMRYITRQVKSAYTQNQQDREGAAE